MSEVAENLTLFANHHAQFHQRVTRCLKFLPGDNGLVRLTDYPLCDPQGHISNISGEFDGRSNRFSLFKVDGELCPVFDGTLAAWTVGYRFDEAIENLCAFLEEYLSTSSEAE